MVKGFRQHSNTIIAQLSTKTTELHANFVRKGLQQCKTILNEI